MPTAGGGVDYKAEGVGGCTCCDSPTNCSSTAYTSPLEANNWPILPHLIEPPCPPGPAHTCQQTSCPTTAHAYASPPLQEAHNWPIRSTHLQPPPRAADTCQHISWAQQHMHNAYVSTLLEAHNWPTLAHLINSPCPPWPIQSTHNWPTLGPSK